MREIASQISSVQVYRRGATVFRTAQVVAGEKPLDTNGRGEVDVELVDLPLSLLDPTTRVRVLAVEPATAEVVAAGVRVGLWVRPGDPPPKAPEQKELEEIGKKLEETQEEIAVLDDEIAILTGVPVPERPAGEDGKPPPPSPMAARLQLERFVDEATRQRLEERRALREKARRLEEDLLRLEERIAAASTAAEVKRGDLVKSAVVRLRTSGGPTKISLELSYVVPGARWAPAYQVKLSRDGAKAEIQLRAWIAQRSGEDWKGVKLRLSTASPLSFTELPQLSSVRIGRAQPAPSKKGFRAPPTGGDALFRDHDRDLGRAGGLVPALPSFSAPDFDEHAAPRVRAADRRMKKARAPRANAGEATSAGAVVMSRDELGDVDKSIVLGRGDDDDDLLMDAEESLAPEPVAMAAPSPSRAMAAPKAAMTRAGTYSAERGRPPDEVVQSLMYSLLRLPGPSERGGRGKLVPANVRALYAESAARAGRPLSFDLMSAVSEAEQEALAVQSAPLPDGCIDTDDISSHFDFAYDADGLVEIVGDGGFHSVALGDRQSEARMRYIAVPREEPSVYRVAMLTNPVPAPLLPGPAELYVGGEYVLTTRLPTVAARGELKLGLGVEQAIKIARNTKFQEVRSGEKVVAMSELVHDVDVDVTNLLEREIEIEVRERVPVPAPGAEVVIEENDVAPSWDAYSQEERGQPIEGGRRWEVKIPGGKSTRLHARYVVKIYANNEIVGGNRREA